jgi:hypothetical protein
MSTAQLADPEHPWIGLAPFTESDSEFFAGRVEEIDELLRLVRRDTLTLLYGVSGLGKTSLLQAGLFPALRAEDYLPVPIRLDYVDGAAPLAQQVLSAITKAAAAAGIEAPALLPGETLWEYFHRENNHFWSPRNDLVTPFLVFDQFEECFTLGRETAGRERRGAAFISELADLVENRPPAALRGDPQRARDFSFKPRPLKVLLAMREDYLAELDRIRSQFRALGQNRLRLLPMGMPQARQVIDLGAALIALGVEDRIVRFVAGSAANADDGEITVAPALLSLVLQQLNERRLEQGADAKITAELLDLQQKKIFEDFYLRTLKPLDPGVRTFIEDRLLTASGYRNSCALDDALSCPGVTQPVLDELVNYRLLAYEDRHRVRRVEITHDVLAPVIRASRDSRISREALAKAERQKAEAQAKERAARRQRAVFFVLLVIAVVAGASFGLITAIFAINEKKRAEAAKDLVTKLLEEASRADVDSAIEVSQDDDWTKQLVFLERAVHYWGDNPDVAPRLWAQLRHGAASRAPLLRWSKSLSEHAKLAWNPAGTLIATVSPTEPLQLWDATSGKLLRGFDNANLKLSASGGDVRFSSDGERIILRRSKDLWSVISVEQRKLIFESESHKLLDGEPISPNGKQAVDRGAEGLVGVISTLTGQPEILLLGFPFQAGKVQWSPRGDRIAISFEPQPATPGIEEPPRTIHIYDAWTGVLSAAIERLEDLGNFWFNESGEYLLVEKNAPRLMQRYEIWHTDMNEAAPIETKQATFAKWFHKDEKKLLWSIPSKGRTSLGTPRENHPVVHTVGAGEKDDIPLLLSDFLDADISDDDSVSLVVREGYDRINRYYYRFELFNLRTGKASTSLPNVKEEAFTCFLSPDARSLALTAKSAFSRWDFAPSQQTWHSSDAKPPTKAREHPKWTVTLRGTLRLSGDSPSVSIGPKGKPPPRPTCSIPLEERPLDVSEWVEDDRKLRVFSRDEAAQRTAGQIRARQQMLKDAGFFPGPIDGLWGQGTEDATRKWEAATGGAQQSYRYTDIEWDPPDPPEAIEKPILNLVGLVIGKTLDKNRKPVQIPDEKRIELRKELETAKVKDRRWQKLLKWWNEGRPGD